MDWRWQLACRLAEAAAPERWRGVDREVRQAKYFADGLMTCRCQEDRRLLAESWPELAWAHAFQFGPPHRRWHLQARILARQENEDIARVIGGSVAVVQSYIDTFFDIRDRLDSPFFILTCAIGPGIATGRARDLGEVWRHAAYHGGPLVLDTLVFPYAGLAGTAPTRLSDVIGDERTELLAQVKLYEAAALAPPTPEALIPLARAQERLNSQMRHFQEKEQERQKREADLREGVRVMQETIVQSMTEAEQMAEIRKPRAQSPFPPPPEPPAGSARDPGSPSTTADSTPEDTRP